MNTHKLILNSDPNNIRLVKTWVDIISMKYNVCEELYPDILICLTEAVNNAIHHGNKRDVNKNISLICIVEKGRLQFNVCDEGSGFSPNKVPDPRLSHRVDNEHGRGVMIMKQLSDNIKFVKRGSKVIMTFKFKRLQ